jgi:serine/threonine protein kinase
MELCDKALDDVLEEFDEESHLKTNGTLTTVGYYIASRIFVQILKGVNHLHDQKNPIIHRDLKPANILLKICGQKGFCVKIADFGLMAIHQLLEQSHTVDKGTPKHMAPEVHKFSEKSHTIDKGTPKYTAPEVINGRKYNTKADIFSLGITFLNLFELELIE